MLQATMDLWALPFGITCCNEAVRNNPRKFPEGYVYELTKEESATLRSKFSTIEASALTLEPVNGKGRHSKYNFKAFTRKGLYMLATCLTLSCRTCKPLRLSHHWKSTSLLGRSNTL